MEKILEVNQVKEYYKIKTGLLQKTQYVKAVDDVSFSIKKGQTFGLVGESGLSFLGFGISKAIPSWGNMLSDAQEGDVISGKPWIWMPPAIMITLTILSINFVGEGLKDAFNPRGRR
ncbi:TPA: hypothetical protein I1R65_002816 [Staphylococcus aureus]|nr:hypothetical protein [Staphylococcus aureus]